MDITQLLTILFVVFVVPLMAALAVIPLWLEADAEHEDAHEAPTATPPVAAAPRMA